MNRISIGGIEVTALTDGEFTTGPDYFGTEASFVGHEDLLGSDGKMRLPIGCFVLRGGPLGGRTILIDAGLGEMSGGAFVGGRLMGELATAGVTIESIDTVICSHLHIDHCGWLIDQSGAPTFGQAQLWAGSGDWRRFVDEGADVMLDHVRAGLRQLAERDGVVLVDGDATVVPGVDALAAPGHTPGHLAIVLSDKEERALLLGDAISCPVQLDETDWGAISDVDPALAARTRERLWDKMEHSGVPAVGAHFPELRFGRVMAGEGRRWWS